MVYKYHVQKHAMDIANSIPEVPSEYPLMEGLPYDFRKRFDRLCCLMRNIYTDISQHPKDYGMVCQDINEEEKWVPAKKNINRLMLVLEHLFFKGSIDKNRLIVNITEIKKCVPNIVLILEQLCNLGFEIEGFDGKKFNKEATSLVVSYIDDIEMFDTIKRYFECYPRFRNDEKLYNKQTYELWGLRRRCFDYKLTIAEISSISENQWVNDDVEYFSNYDDKSKLFVLALYSQYSENSTLCKSLKYMTFYNNGRFHMEYYHKGKRLIRASGSNSDLRLAIKLRNMDSYMDYIYTLPEYIRKHFEHSNCWHCNDENCKNRVMWTYHGQQQIGCAFNTFEFLDLCMDDIKFYIRLIELECLINTVC